MANRHIKRCSMWLIIRESKSKLQWGITSPPSEWPSLKNLQTVNAGEDVEQRNPECNLIQPLWRTVRRVLKKLERELPYDPTIPLLGIYPEKTIIQKVTWTPMFIAGLLTLARTWKQPDCPSIEEWIKKMWCIYTVEYYSAIKRVPQCHLQQHA